MASVGAVAMTARRPFRLLATLLAPAALALGCAGAPTAGPQAAVPPSAATAGQGGVVEVTLLQLNDVYEIGPVEGGRSGGLARVATLRQRLLAENRHTFTVLAGDFLSPSALGTAKVGGQALAGKQMVAVLNALGLDLVTFGNHELDVKEPQLLERLAESRFRWTSANVRRPGGEPFPGVSRRGRDSRQQPGGLRLLPGPRGGLPPRGRGP
jgi:2',3'-cyclic-nucleotide 2'-phosphodiesterase (5'-nucleotidase family)